MKVFLMLLLLSLVLSSPMTASAASIIGDYGTNLEACWDMDETSGTRLDATANNNDLTDNNTVLSATGKIDNGADFELSNSESLSITDAAQTGLDLAGDFSYQTWINIESVPATGMELLAKTNGGSARSYNLEIQGTGDGSTLKAFVSGDGTTANRRQDISNAAIITTDDIGVFVHIVITFDVDTGNYVFYRNGSSVASTANDAGTVTSINNSANFVQLGANNFLGTPESFFDGVQDVVAIWSRTLSGADITSIYNAGAGIACAGAATPSSFGDIILFE